MKQSAGLLLYRITPTGNVGVLLVHASGPYNKKSPWSIPKGEPDEGESLEQTARREVSEETGVDVTGAVRALGFIDYTKSRKRIHAFAAALPEGANPRCASWEIDQCVVHHIDDARRILHPDQVPFLDRLLQQLKEK